MIWSNIFSILWIVLIGIALSYIILLLNSKFLWLNHSLESNSFVHSSGQLTKTSSVSFDNQINLVLGRIFIKLLPEKVLENLKLDYFYLDREEEELYVTLGQSVLIALVFFAVYFISNNSIFLILAIFVPILLGMEASFEVQKAKAEVEENIDHVVRCLKVLVVKTETPILTALEKILEGLPKELNCLNFELKKIINKAKQSGVKVALNEWKTDQPRFRDFIALLISISEGASKTALRLSIESFLEKVEDDKKQHYKNKSENLQLYLMGPVILMLLVIMVPMMDAIIFFMQGAVDSGVSLKF